MCHMLVITGSDGLGDPSHDSAQHLRIDDIFRAFTRQSGSNLRGGTLTEVCQRLLRYESRVGGHDDPFIAIQRQVEVRRFGREHVQRRSGDLIFLQRGP